MTEPSSVSSDRAQARRDETASIRAIVAGAVIAVLAPLFGFLGGSMAGYSQGSDALTGIYLWLFLGLAIGGVGALVALVTGLRVLRRRRGR